MKAIKCFCYPFTKISYPFNDFGKRLNDYLVRLKNKQYSFMVLGKGLNGWQLFAKEASAWHCILVAYSRVCPPAM